jgi:integrative and conjugative element protein (TIGR02256 family)
MSIALHVLLLILIMLRYRIGKSNQFLNLSADVLRHFANHRQSKAALPEAGGQLFARLKDEEISVVAATGPRSTDRRGRTSYTPDRHAEQSEINEFHADGLHYIGDWHTHPAAVPVPSGVDIGSILDTANRSTHDLNGLILIIVGTDPFPLGLRVSLYDGLNELVLEPIDAEGKKTERKGRLPLGKLINKMLGRDFPQS